MRKVAGLSACAVIIICFLATTVLAAFPYVNLVPDSEKLEGKYIGSTLCYRASIAGTMGEGGGGFASYLQCRLYKSLTWITSSYKVRLWGTPSTAITGWRELSGSYINGKAYGYYQYRDDPEQSAWLKTWY